MSTQRVLLMLFVTVAVAWMVGYAEGKHAADRWWQADEAKKAQTIRNWIPHWGMDGTFCGDNSGCYTMKDGLCVSGDCFGKPTIPSGENLWQDGQENPAPGGGKYSRLPYPVCMEDTGIGYGLVPIPCPKEKPKQ